MANAKADNQEPEITLGDPIRAVGHVAFMKHMGGGMCLSCESFANVLMSDGKCAHCSGVCDAPVAKPAVTNEADAAVATK
jgi:hypothetical protein